MRLRHWLHAFDTPVLLTDCTKQTGLSHQKTQGTRMNAHTFQRGTGITHHAQDRRSTLIRSIAALAASAVGGAAHASTISGTVNTGAPFSPTNLSPDGTTFFNTPPSGPFALVTIG